MEQCVYEVTDLPEGGLDASAAFAKNHLNAVKASLGQAVCNDLTIVLPPAGPDHADWRRALARDLARAFAPKRVNVIVAEAKEARRATLAYLGNAKGVTGHYLESL